jgi:nucleotide-binding universal stress UspA family protein
MILVGTYGDHARALKEARKLGLTIHQPVRYVGVEELDTCNGTVAAVVWAPRASSAEEATVDAWGGRRLFAFNNSGCIRSPSVKRRFLDTVEQLARKGCNIVVDALRYPSPHDGKHMLSCFCSHCLRAQPRLEAVKRSLLEAIARKDPEGFAHALQELAEARAEAVEELAAQARDTAKAYGVSLEAAVFPPSISWLVGKRLDRLARIYDRLQIMLYHRCGGPACHNHEHAALQKLIKELGLPSKETLEHLGVEPPGDPEVLEKEGSAPDTIAKETAEAMKLAGNKAVPILWLDDKAERVVRAVERIAGADRVVLFAPA